MISQMGLEIQNITHRFGRLEAVQDVTLSVAPGEIHCLLGPSGSGKSTLLRIISGLLRQHQGTVSIGESVVSDASKHQLPEHRQVGFVFQDYALFPHLNALRNVLFGMSARRSQVSQERARQVLADVGLGKHLESMPHTLSGGEQQRVALARAMVRTPNVMLLDEPFSGLDVQLRQDVRETTLRVLRASKISTVMVTHDPAEAMSCADRVSVMYGGQIVQTDQPQSIYRDPVDDRIARSFGLVNLVSFEERDGRCVTPFGEWTGETRRSFKQQDCLFVRPEELFIGPPVDGEPQYDVVRMIPEAATVIYEVRGNGTPAIYVRSLATEPRIEFKRVSVRLR
ncbi:MAG: ABC transporter ATP-binding protein [Fuerstiella sp.]|nr:ABC transporter ATP-binding protein [Fuerstiella sp.]